MHRLFQLLRAIFGSCELLRAECPVLIDPAECVGMVQRSDRLMRSLDHARLQYPSLFRNHRPGIGDNRAGSAAPRCRDCRASRSSRNAGRGGRSEGPRGRRLTTRQIGWARSEWLFDCSLPGPSSAVEIGCHSVISGLRLAQAGLRPSRPSAASAIRSVPRFDAMPLSPHGAG
jgi:hypothetical protein